MALNCLGHIALETGDYTTLHVLGEDQTRTTASSPAPIAALVEQSSSSLSLTPRECEVLQLLTQGLTSAQIAKELIITPLTVNSHVRSIYNKLGVTSRSAATRYAIEHQLA